MQRRLRVVSFQIHSAAKKRRFEGLSDSSIVLLRKRRPNTLRSDHFATRSKAVRGRSPLDERPNKHSYQTSPGCRRHSC